MFFWLNFAGAEPSMSVTAVCPVLFGTERTPIGNTDPIHGAE